MNIVEEVRDWIATCPYLEQFTSGAHIDWTDAMSGNYGIMPTGCKDVETVEDVMGGITKRKQYALSLFARNWTVDDVMRMENACFIDNFQAWVEEQQAQGLTPKIGDNPEEETISAQNGVLFELSENGQTGLYQIQITITYEKHYKRKDVF